MLIWVLRIFFDTIIHRFTHTYWMRFKNKVIERQHFNEKMNFIWKKKRSSKACTHFTQTQSAHGVNAHPTRIGSHWRVSSSRIQIMFWKICHVLYRHYVAFACEAHDCMCRLGITFFCSSSILYVCSVHLNDNVGVVCFSAKTHLNIHIFS